MVGPQVGTQVTEPSGVTGVLDGYSMVYPKVVIINMLFMIYHAITILGYIAI